MKHISQPPGSHLCGQACVAMVAGITLEESIAIFRKQGETETKELVAALRTLGISCGDRLIRVKRGVDPPPCCIMVLHYEGAPMRHWHWVVCFKGLFYDPAESIGVGYEDGVRMTSYLPVYLTETEVDMKELICVNTFCTFHKDFGNGEPCPAAAGCAGYMGEADHNERE